MPGLAPKLPIHRDKIDGYGLIKSYRELAKQNLKMLILTSPGERMMDPEFGVGLRRYLFQQNVPATYSEIDSKIHAQVNAYLPYIKITKIDFTRLGELEFADEVVNINIHYNIAPLAITDALDLTLDYATVR